MKISEMIKELESIQKVKGDIPVQLQSSPKTTKENIVNYGHFFIVPEKYDEGMICNIRSWAY